jgi:AAA+ ATPase superfamily predicted ATPase
MFSEPVAGERFFGREEILELLEKRAAALKDGYRQNVALTGQSLAGKSSIILQFLRSVREEGLVPVYVEVVKEPFRSFCNKFIATMLYNALSKKGEDVDISLDSLTEKAQGLLPKTSQAIKQVNALADRGEVDDAYMELLGLTSALKDETGIPCVVILDEFDNLEHLGVKNPYQSFGKAIMVQKDTMYIVSSSRNAAIRKIISEKLSLLFGNFEIVKVANFGAKAACRFMDSKLAGFETDDFIRKFLFSFTDGNPFYMEKILSRLKDLAIENMTSCISNDITAAAIVDTVYNSGGAIHQYITNYILDLIDTKNKDLHLGVLAAIASGNNRQPDIARSIKVKQSEVSKALVLLCDKALISKNGAFYRIDDVMMEFWLKYVYQRRKEILVDGAFDRMRLFKDDISSYIASCEKDFSATATSRIAELFGIFSNELVQMDMKNVRLPRFTKVETRTSEDGQSFITASFRGNYWVVEVYEQAANENDIISFIRNVKSIDCKISNKVIIPLKGIDENAKLLAKELRISIWDGQTTNALLGLYKKKRIMVL